MQVHIVYIDWGDRLIFAGAFAKEDDAAKHADELQAPSGGEAYYITVDVR